MSAQFFECKKHIIRSQHVRSHYRATTSPRDVVLYNEVKQYTPLSNRTPQYGDITIIAGHASGFPKELYEPLWDDILRISEETNAFRIRSIWFADVYFQGQSGVMNEAKLGDDPSWADHARDLLHMVNTFADEMPQPIVGVAHSMGACAVVNLALLHPSLFTTLVLAEAMIKRLGSGRQPSNLMAAHTAISRQDIWPSRESAMQDLRKTKMFKFWDARVVELYVNNALRALPTTLYPDPPKDMLDAGQESEAVTLTTTKHQEAFGVARGCYPASRAPDSVFQPNRLDHLGIMTGVPHNPEATFYRPEMLLTFTQLPQLTPSCMYISGEDAVNGELIRKDLVATTGKGLCGNGGAEAGAVRNVIIPRTGHFVAFEAPQEVARIAVEWLGQELRRWSKEQELAKLSWNTKTGIARQTVDDDYQYWMKTTFKRGMDEAKRARAEAAKVQGAKL